MPENHGNVEYPRGHPDCLAKLTFVISGVLDSMMRDQATEYIKRHGGRVTTSVSSKTTFLLCGTRLFP
jgi:replication factor C subunit 1